MKNIKNINEIYLENYDVKVKPYLTYAQIQHMINSVATMRTWSEREQNLDMCILYYATNIGKDNIEKIGHDTFLASGLLDAVKSNIKNLDMLREGIAYNESTARALLQLLDQFPNLLATIESKVGNNARSKK